MKEEDVMCVGLAAKVVSVSGGKAVVDATGAERTVSAELLDNLYPGDFVMVHAGMAIAKINDDNKIKDNGKSIG